MLGQTLEGFRLSPQQRHLWSVQKAGRDTDATYTLHIHGPLHIDRLYAALKQVFEQNEILYTIFERRPGFTYPLQVIADSPSFDWQQHDITGLSPTEQAAFLQEKRSTLAASALASDKSIELIHLSGLEYKLLIRLPSLCADRATMVKFLGDLCSFYDPLSQNREDENDSIQYADFSEWQNELIESDETEPERAYWQKLKPALAELSGYQLPLAKPAVRSQDALQQFSMTLDQSAVAQIELLAEQYETTPSVILLTTWHLLHWHHRQQAAQIIGVALDGRKFDELADTYGLLTKHVPIPAHITGKETFAQLLSQIDQTAVDAYDQMEYFAWEALQLDTKEVPFFPIRFDFVEQPKSIVVDGVSFAMDSQSAPVEYTRLDLTCFRIEKELTLVFTYDPDAYHLAAVETLAKQFHTLLVNGCANPHTFVGDLTLLGQDERHHLVVDFNQTSTSAPLSQCAHALFEAQVARVPNEAALVYGQSQLTYEELDQRANALAHQLQKEGVGPDVCVGLYVQRSPEMVIGLLAIMKAGAAYLPLDPSYPEERLTFMLADAHLSIILTQQTLAERLPSSVGRAEDISVLYLDAFADEDAPKSTHGPDSAVQPDNLAYVIYTSGSTGKPKGAMITHRGLVNYLQWSSEAYDPTIGTGVPVHSSIGFDLTVTSLITPLVSGQRVILLPEENDIEAFSQYLRAQQGLSLVKITPAHLEAVNRHLADEQLDSHVHTFVIGGEALHGTTVAPWHSLETRLINEYGPTEAVVGCCIYEANIATDLSTILPIGTPIANTQLYVLDEQLQPVATGIIGELYIGGVGVARGYLNRPDQTAARFIPSPFANQPGDRLYRTGDLVRFVPLSADGSCVLDFVGRVDHQVKVRGYRIELGEIEAALRQHEAITEAAVLLREDTPNNKRLVAYLAASSKLIVTELQDYLGQTLPEYMIPAAFVTLDALPLTNNGKVDRPMLPVPGTERPLLERSYHPPETMLEHLLVDAWEEMLEIDPVGIHDNFFALGGDSIKGAILINNVQKRLGEVVHVAALFEAPTVQQMALYLQETYPQGIERLVQNYLLYANDISSWNQEQATLPTIEPVSRLRLIESQHAAQFPLSFAQQRLWFLARLSDESNIYNVPVGLQLRGPLDVEALERTLGKIVERHDVLRTTFPTVDGMPVQEIAPFQKPMLSIMDWQYLTMDEQAKHVADTLQKESKFSFDLAHGPLLRFSLFKLGPENHTLLLTTHHIVVDGWSMTVLMHELVTFYETFAAGEAFDIDDLPIQYADFALWQRQWLSGAVFDSQMAYWRAQLAEPPTLLALPIDYPRPAMQSFQGRHLAFQLDSSLSQQVVKMSHHAQATLFMTLMAAFATLLARLSNQDDIIIGSPIANRVRQELEGLIGFFVNTLALRLQMRDNLCFSDVLAQARRVTLEAFSHQDIPFEQLLEALQPERDLSHQPLFQVMFVMQNMQGADVSFGDMTVDPVDIENVTAKFDLTLMMSETPDGLSGIWEYNSGLFDGETIERFHGYFVKILQEVTSDPEVRLWSLPLLNAAEQDEIVQAWQGTREETVDSSIHELFEAQVAKSPLGTALVWDGEHVSYSTLDSRANQLAHHLQDLGIGLETPVGVCMDRSVEMVVGILAILKAGGAYVPLDPTYPVERLAYMLADANIATLLTQSHLLDHLPAHTIESICLDTLALTLPSTPCHSDVTADNLAYIIYTSGSTGDPKGVAVTHGSLNNVITEQIIRYELEEGCRLLKFLSLSFDAATSHLFMALCSGTALHLVTPNDIVDPEALCQLLATQEITHAPLPSTILARLPDVDLPALKVIITGGESCSTTVVERWADRVHFSNEYGPTEATICSTIATCVPDSKIPSIGQAIRNTTAYILDSAGQPVPVGLSGELYIAGKGLARGYHGRADLTAARFLPDPFTTEASARMYRTGDLARYRADGALEFLGRADHQVKVRGYRIELGEIESALSHHPEIQEAIVMVQPHATGSSQLVAYVVPESKDNVDITIAELRDHLRQRLPDYMVPAAFLILPTFPLTPNGKVDRKTLSTRQVSARVDDGELIEARDEIEAALMAIWQEVLGVESISVQDNFFDLGGHSLLVVQLMARVQQTFGDGIPLSAFFQHGTIAEQANLLRGESTASPLVTLQPQGEKRPLFFIHPIGGNVLCYRNLANLMGTERPIYGLQFVLPDPAQKQGDHNRDPNKTNIEEMAANYIQAVRSVQPYGPYQLIGWSMGGLIAYEMAQQLEDEGKEIAMLALIDTAAKNKLPKVVDRTMIMAYMAAEWGMPANILPTLFEELSQVEPDEQLDRLLIQIRALNERTSDISRGQLEEMFTTIETNLYAMDGYTPRSSTQRVLLLHSEDRQTRQRRKLAEEWKTLAMGGVVNVEIPGDHHEILSKPFVQNLANELIFRLDNFSLHMRER